MVKARAYGINFSDEVRTPRLNFNNLFNAKLTFDVAHAAYNTSYIDGLEVLVSNDCGATFTSVYSKSGIILATVPTTNTYFTPTAGQWRNDTITSQVPKCYNYIFLGDVLA